MNQQRSRNGSHIAKRRMGALLLCGLMLFAVSGLAASASVSTWQELFDAAKANRGADDTLTITITADINQSDAGAGEETIVFHSSVKNLTIVGNNNIITGNGTDQIMRIGDYSYNKDKVVTISDLTMTDGNAAGSTNESKRGGALFVDGDATLTNCTFTDNSASAYGGAVYVMGDATITNSTFEENSAGTSGGAVYAGTATIEGGTFEENSAGNDGGAVNAGTATIEDSTFTENSAKQNGGGVYIYEGDAEIKNTEFTGNTADSDNDGNGSGGAVYHYDSIGTGTGTLTITDSEFTGNNVTTGGTDPNNNNPTGGGSISSNADIVFEGDNTFSGNSAGDDPHPSTDPDAPDLGTYGYGIENKSGEEIDTANANMILIDPPTPNPGGGKTRTTSEPIPAETQGTEAYQGGGLVSNATVYAEANTDSGEVGTVQAGAPIQLVRWGGGGTWCKIIYNNGNNSGWVQGRHIK